jgi:hypothetical protein
MAGGIQWREDELFKLESMYDSGKTIKAMATVLGRSQDAISSQLSRSGLLVKEASFFTSNEFARRMGISSMKVYHWSKWNIIAVQKLKVSALRRVTRITWESIWAFLADEQTWMLWSVDAIVDVDMREYAQRLRSNQQWKWLTTKEAATRIGFSADVLRTWVRVGRLQATAVMGYNYIDSRVLANFIAPSER